MCRVANLARREQEITLEGVERVGDQFVRRAVHVGERTCAVGGGLDASDPVGHGCEDLAAGRWVMGLGGHGPTVREPARASIRRAARPDTENYGFALCPLVYITGKGGTGKTSVAAALAQVLAAEGGRVLICDLAGAGGAQRRGDRIWSLSLDPEQALGEWLARHAGTAAAAVLRRSHAFSYLVAAAPGAAEMVVIGKAVDLASQDDYDCVIVDGPATGHALGMLGAPQTFAGLVAGGPVATEARRVGERLADPAFAAYVGVTLPEPMPVTELLDLQRALPALVGRGLDLVVVNAVHPDRFSDADAQRLRAVARRSPVGGPLKTVLAEHRRARREAEQITQLRERVNAPVITLPFVFPPATARDRLERLARALTPASALLSTDRGNVDVR